MRRAAVLRFADKIALTDSGCIDWLGSTIPAGYGRFWSGAGVVYAHRWSYEHHLGKIPDGMQIDHLCRNTSCVNPDHLEPVTQHINLLRGHGWAGEHARKTHCPAGHPYAGANLYLSRSGERHCRACRRNRAQAQRDLVKVN